MAPLYCLCCCLSLCRVPLAFVTAVLVTDPWSAIGYCLVSNGSFNRHCQTTPATLVYSAEMKNRIKGALHPEPARGGRRLYISRIQIGDTTEIKAVSHNERQSRAHRWSTVCVCVCVLEVCMEMGKTGIPMGMGVRSAMGWEWELRRGSCHQQLWIVFCSYIVTWSKGSNAGGATASDWVSCAELK